MLKIAVSGKGGVGKTTFSALLAGTLAMHGTQVIAVDADPDANLPSALGVPLEDPITPLAEMHDFIAERTGTKEDAIGGYFKLNPRVDDIPDRFARRLGNIRLLVLGGVSKGGGGCICPATTVLKALLVHLLLGRDDAIVMDMEAGIEHLGRATAQSMDALMLVVDEGPWSVQTALRVKDLAGDLGLKKIFAVANRITNPDRLADIAKRLGGIPLLGHLDLDPRLVNSIVSTDGDGSFQPSPALLDYRPMIDSIIARVNEMA